ncbi:MAG: hypothetical protein IJW29_01300 [Clostridia bacterium]|nr:hypothetical protein [Clostridia bacterium]
MSAPEHEKTINPWQDRSGFTRVHGANILLAFLTLALCAFALTCAGDERVALIVLPVLFIYTVLIVKTPATVIHLLLCAVAAFFLTSSFSGASVVLALIVGVSVLAWLLTVLKSFFAVPLVLVAVFAASWLITGDLSTSVLAFALLPAGAAMAIATVWGKDRTSVIVWAQIGLFLTVVALAMALIARNYGAVNADTVTRAVADLRAGAVDSLGALRDEMIKTLQAGGEENAEMIARLGEVLGDNMLHTAVTAVICVLPGLVGMACGIIAFEAQLLLGTTYLRTGWKQVLTREACMFTMSATASVLYVIASFMTLFLGVNSIFGAAVQNLYLILLPGFCVLGLGAVSARMRRPNGGSLMLLLLLGAMLCCTSVYALSFLSLWGAFANIGVARRARKSEGDDDNDD